MDIKQFSIPQTAGCYLFKDSKDQIIYVGKSKYLPKRVSSYFQKNHKDTKTVKLVTEIKSVDFISTESENEALVLEEDLIKLYKPKFNIKGKDSRTIRSKLILTGGEWKKLELVFPGHDFDGEVIAEFTSGKVSHEVLELVNDLFKLRSCSYEITSENVEKKKFKACLDWHIGKCSAPCVGLASKIDYHFSIKLIRDIFNFNFKTSKSYFTRKMKYHSSKLEFETAQVYKEKLQKLVTISGLLKPLLTIKLRNRAVEIKDSLFLKNTPTVIDAFDNSHTAGTDAVCGLVRYTLFNPQKDEYRKFIIKSGAGGDDYASFNEVLTRRFSRLITEKKNLPNLVIIDGARPQLNVALSVLTELGVLDKVDVISISKDEKHRPEKIHLQNGKTLNIKGHTELAKIIEEVHRFSIEFHRKRRSKNMFNKG